MVKEGLCHKDQAKILHSRKNYYSKGKHFKFFLFSYFPQIMEALNPECTAREHSPEQQFGQFLSHIGSASSIKKISQNIVTIRKKNLKEVPLDLLLANHTQE
ncbi:hypothetical protein Leryth_024195 [Lithospermum erythrorhizon]|nr:hypothetical protein Leryth_024195 [Lithospermum erythrorhizon]